MSGNESHFRPRGEPARTDTIEADVCVIGAGPHGLAAALSLNEAAPSLRIATIDPSGMWLSTWHSQMRRAGVATLRSPIVHSPSCDPGALARHLQEHGLASSGLPYDIPTVSAFEHFCDELVAGSPLAKPIAAEVSHATIVDGGVRVETDGPTVIAAAAVVATNPHRRNIPEWVWPLLGREPGLVEHAADVDLDSTQFAQHDSVAVIGGGLSAAHLACGAASQGAHVHLIARRALETRSFDTDPGWLGPKFLDDFEAESDPNIRLHIARRARGGGTVPPWMRERIDRLVQQGDIVLHDATDVRAASIVSDSSCRLALTDGEVVDATSVLLGTGTTPHVAGLRFLSDVLADLPELSGYPILADDLKLGGHPIHVMGRLATLTLGPAAGNLWGAQQAARLITAAIVGAESSDIELANLAPRSMG